ncbi:hypothetical protein [Peribacillus sp. NPDC097895]
MSRRKRIDLSIVLQKATELVDENGHDHLSLGKNYKYAPPRYITI